jgi:sugar lactone lactonase YvrE
MPPGEIAVARVAHTADVLGEVPIWSVREQALYWIDAFKPGLHRYDPATGAVTSWTPPVKLGSFALRAAGGMLLASRAGLGIFDPATGSFALLHNPEADRPNNLLNDGRCDRRGRFWVGSMDRMIERPSARLYRFDPDHACHVMQDGVWLTNGVAFSPDDRRLYFADSHLKTISCYDVDLAGGTIANRRLFATVDTGLPDGSCVDTDGCLWNVEFHASRVVRYAPDGRIDRIVALPVTQPTACTFGGPDLRTLYVTTARLRLPDDALAAQPDAGALLAITGTGAQGVAEPLFAG